MDDGKRLIIIAHHEHFEVRRAKKTTCPDEFQISPVNLAISKIHSYPASVLWITKLSWEHFFFQKLLLIKHERGKGCCPSPQFFNLCGDGLDQPASLIPLR